MLYYLAEVGADMNKGDDSSNRPLHIAINSENYDSVRFLLSLNADVNSINN